MYMLDDVSIRPCDQALLLHKAKAQKLLLVGCHSFEPLLLILAQGLRRCRRTPGGG